MGRSFKARLEAQEARTKIAELKAREIEAIASTTTQKRLQSISMKYDAITRPTRGTNSRPSVELKDERGQHNPMEWAKGVASARDLERNFAGTKALLRQKRVLCVRQGPKLAVKSGSDAFDAAATGFFNEDWAKSCDSRDDLHFGDFIGLSLTAAYREGGLLVMFDDLVRNDGGLMAWEVDQLAEVEPKEWPAYATARNITEDDGTPYIQNNGAVLDAWGRVHGYIVTRKRGFSRVSPEEATYLPRWHQRWNPNGSARLFKLPWRVNQYHGTPDLFAIANEQWDIYEMKRAELASAKAASRRVAFVETGEESEMGVIRALQKAGMTPDQLDQVLSGSGSEDEQAQAKALVEQALGNRYDTLESELGAILEYGNPGDKLTMHQHDRPAASVRDWADNAQEVSGAALGLARSRATWKAQGSYTAFRGEELMTWEGAQFDQKALERSLCDFCAIKAIGWAIARRQITETAPAGWERRLAWTWPQMQEVDEERAERAIDLRLKGGRTDYGQVVGPGWKNHFEALEVQLDDARERNLPLGILEMKSGGASPSGEGPSNPEETTE